jgi:glucose dehydrogenase
VFGAWQSNPLVVDGIMYVTQRPNDVVALDAKTGRVFWLYRYTPSPDARVCCGANNRGVASSATRCTWAPSMGMSSRSTRRAAARSGTSRWPTSSSRTRSRWRRSS